MAESLSNVVKKSLHASSKESPVKLFMVQRTAEPVAPSSSNGNYYYLLLRRGRQEEPKEPKEEQAQKLTQSQQNNRLPFY